VFSGYDKGDTIPSVPGGFGWKRKYGFPVGSIKNPVRVGVVWRRLHHHAID